MRTHTKRKSAVMAAAALAAVLLVPGAAAADHPTPPGEGLLESPFPLTCDGRDGVIGTVTPSEFETAKSGGPGWLSGIGMAIPRSLTIVADGIEVFAITYGNKTAKGLETITCTGTAIGPGGPAQAVFVFALLP